MTEEPQNPARSLPAVSAVLDLPRAHELVETHGRGPVTNAIRSVTGDLRAALLAAHSTDVQATTPPAVLEEAERRLDLARQPTLRPAINATGIVLHTGLGRAVMPDAARDAVASMTGCCTIQMDMDTGKRIKREACVRDLVRELTGAEDTLVVNNNAGATLLVLRALAQGKAAVVSRGELIEIGGAFRLPDIMSESGAILHEIGTTNKTHARDYESAIHADTGLLLKVHKSNYQVIGFSKDVAIGEIARIGQAHNVPVVDDLGCGALVDLEPYGLGHEVTLRESLAAGADVALASTDKLIGGPQGGLIVGRADLIDRIRSHPLYRAFRVDKMTLAALEATLRLFKAPDRLAKTHPVYTMLAKTPLNMETQARQLADLIRARQTDWDVSVVPETSFLGGGSLPAATLPSFAVRLTSSSRSAESIARGLRTGRPAVVPRIADNGVLLDMRTVAPGDVADIAAACGAATAHEGPGT